MITNIITPIRKLYRLHDGQSYGMTDFVINQSEQNLNIQLPALLYHFYREFGNLSALTTSHNQLTNFPLQFLDNYLLIATENQNVCVWGIHRDNLMQHDPMVFVSQNYDDINSNNVHWYADQPLSSFLLSQAIFNGTMGGLSYCANVLDFSGERLPHDLATHISKHFSSIIELEQPHEQYFTDDLTTVILLSMNEHQQPTAIFMASQNKTAFESCSAWLKIKWDYYSINDNPI